MGVEYSTYASRPRSWLSSVCEIPTIPEEGEDWDCCQQIVIGYDGGGMGSLDGLSRRRELVELLDSEPVFAYLLQNGVLEPQQVDDIKKEASPAKVNLALLRHVEGGQVAGAQQLLVNALRQSGQLQLANMLDDSRRITALTASGYLSKSRRKGQVQLQVKVKALRLPRDTLPLSLNPPATPAKPPAPPREWVSLDDIHLRILALTSIPSQQSVTNTTTPEVTKKKRKPFCLCACFAHLFTRNRKKELNASMNESFKSKSTTVYYNNQRNSFNTVVSSSAPAINKLSTTQSQQQQKVQPGQSLQHLSTAESQTQLEQLRHMADVMKTKAATFNELVQDASTQSHVALVKYFEQERGTLVLESRTTGASGGGGGGGACGSGDSDVGGVVAEQSLGVVTICVKASQVAAVRRDVTSGQLVTDVEALVDEDELFSHTGASGLKLEITVDMEELDIAENELSGTS